MIVVKVSEDSKAALYAEVNQKINGMKELLSADVKRKISDVAFSKAALDFVRKTNMLARSNSSMLHHVYEWNGVGRETSRLFRIVKKNGPSGSISIYYKFNNSRKNAPINAILKSPGSTGKSVSKSGIFKRKAEVMESGRPVSFITSKTIVIPSGNSIAFIPPGKTINIKNPGGASTTGAFEKHYRMWWMTNFPAVLEKNGIPKKIEVAVAKALTPNGAGRSAAKSAIIRTLNRYQTVGSII